MAEWYVTECVDSYTVKEDDKVVARLDFYYPEVETDISIFSREEAKIHAEIIATVHNLFELLSAMKR